MPERTDSTDRLWQVIRQLFIENWSAKHPIRLIGMGVSGLSGLNEQAGLTEQCDLFERPENTRLDKIADRINARFGKSTLQRGRSKQK